MAEDVRDSGIPLSRKIIAIKLAAVAVGLLILIIAVAAGWSNVSSDNKESELEEAMALFLDDLAVYQGVNAYDEPLANHFDVIKLSAATPEQVEADLDPGYDFVIEIIDVSQYSESLSFTEENGNALLTAPSGSSDTQLVQERSAALVLGDQTHAAVLRVTLMA